MVVHPERFDAARERGHALVVAVGGVDVPLAVRRQVVQHQRSVLFGSEPQIGVLFRQRLRLIAGQVLSKVDVSGVVEIEVLPPGERPPRHQAFHVVGERRVGSPVFGQP